MKNILVELPIWATTVNIDWVPEVIYRDHLLEIGNAKSSYEKEHLTLPQTLVDIVHEQARLFWGEYGLNPEYKPEIINCWSNKHGKGGWTDWHNHGRCDLAAVWYCKFKEGNGNLVFRNPLDIYQSSETRYDEPLITVPIQEKDLIIFPSFLLHKTEVNELDDERIIVSMNLEGRKYD